MSLAKCLNVDDFRKLAKKKLPSPIFHYIDGGADDEVTLKRNTAAFNDCDLVPSVLRDVSSIDMSTTVFGQKIDMPLFLAPTAMHRLYHHQGEKATSRAAEKFGTFFGMSTIATTGIEEIGSLTNGPKLFQLYIHKDKGLTDNLVERCQKANFKALCLTVDTIVAGNRERDHRTGFTTPPKLTLASLISFALHPEWTLNYLFHERFKLPNLPHTEKDGHSIETSVINYINSQFDHTMNWKDAEYVAKKWNGAFAIKGIVSVEDAKKAVDIGATAIMISNHGGRQLDASMSPFDVLADIVDAVGDKVDVILDGGVRRGTHVLKALALGAKACSFGKGYLYALGAGGQQGVEAILRIMHDEIKRGMTLMGCRNVKEITRDKVIFRKK
jgi:L-lactate dehydrogenase (cytochrome)